MTSFRRLLQKFWRSTELRGVPRAVQSSSPFIRAFWGVSSLVCFVMLLWQATTLLMHYYMYVVAINAYNANDTPHFPKVLICNQNPYDRMSTFNMSYSQYLDFLLDIRSQVALTPSAHYANNDGLWRDLRSERFYLSTQHSFPGTPPLPPNSQFITDCDWFTWNWSIYNTGNGTDCLEALKILWTPNNNECYLYNTPTTGLMGFSTIVYIDNFPSTIFNSFKMNLGVTMTAGIRLYIYPNNTYPLIYFNGINISPGTEVTITMAETEVTHLSEPYSSCTDQKLLDPTDPDSPLYTQDACFTICRQQQYVEICDCIVTYEAFTPKQQQAVNYTFCTSKLLKNNYSDVIDLMMYPMCDYFLWGNNSLCDCPIPCTETVYDFHTTIANWPNFPNQLAFYDTYIKPNPHIYGNKFDAYGDLEKQSINMTTFEIVNEIQKIGLIEKNFIQLNIRITVDNYLVNEDLAAMDWFTLFSEMGGTLELWLGITALFAAEVVEFIFHAIRFCFSKKILHKVENSPDEEMHGDIGSNTDNINSPYDEDFLSSLGSESMVDNVKY